MLSRNNSGHHLLGGDVEAGAGAEGVEAAGPEGVEAAGAEAEEGEEAKPPTTRKMGLLRCVVIKQ